MFLVKIVHIQNSLEIGPGDDVASCEWRCRVSFGVFFFSESGCFPTSSNFSRCHLKNSHVFFNENLFVASSLFWLALQTGGKCYGHFQPTTSAAAPPPLQQQEQQQQQLISISISILNVNVNVNVNINVLNLWLFGKNYRPYF